jgi:uncharacterized protein YdcH (DUF465 family)
MKEATADNRIRALEDRHQSLDREIQILSRRAYLTPDEQKHAAELKKAKLSAKDELYALRASRG